MDCPTFKIKMCTGYHIQYTYNLLLKVVPCVGLQQHWKQIYQYLQNHLESTGNKSYKYLKKTLYITVIQ